MNCIHTLFLSENRIKIFVIRDLEPVRRNGREIVKFVEREVNLKVNIVKFRSKVAAPRRPLLSERYGTVHSNYPCVSFICFTVLLLKRFDSFFFFFFF